MAHCKNNVTYPLKMDMDFTVVQPCYFVIQGIAFDPNENDFTYTSYIMYIWMCMHACMHVFMSVCMYANIYVCMLCMYV